MAKPTAKTGQIVRPTQDLAGWAENRVGVAVAPDHGVRSGSSTRVETDGKFFRKGRERFTVRGVTYGTFKPRDDDGARVPDRAVAKRDFAAISDAGFNVVRTYTPPPPDLIELASDWDLHLFAGLFFPDWRYLVGGGRREAARVEREARQAVRTAARSLSGEERVFAVTLGNEIPADTLRWVGTERIARVLADLAEIVREEDPDVLVTYGNYPTAEYLPLECLDFLTFNVFLERRVDLRRYLTRLHHLAGDRPLILGEVGLDAGTSPESEERQAGALDWQLETALERGLAGTCVFSWTDEWWVGDSAVEGWHFGLTREDRTPRPSLAVAADWNRRTIADVTDDWPSISVVICAYNAEATLDECLAHTCALDYPDLEVIVVDDGSTDATAAIASRHPGARLVRIPHAGLSVARNEGCRAATGDIVAYLDSDAYPSPEWPYFIALGFDDRTVAGCGGPNVPPRDDPIGAQQVALAPGGPVHVLVSDDRAEHVPGCNMAFYRTVIDEVGGFDAVYTAAGDDVDFCWRVLDRGYEIGFHPAALVWHHRRPGLRPYLRQQRGYGRAEALVEARHPDRFTPVGTARWKGRIYGSATPSLLRARVYRGLYGAAAYQSVYRADGYGLDLLHQAGVPLAAVLMLLAPAALLSRPMALLPIAGAVLVISLFIVDVARLKPPPHLQLRVTPAFRVGAAAMHVLQPVARTWGRLRNGALARRDLPPHAALPEPVTRLPGRVLLFPSTAERVAFVGAVVADLRRAGYRILTPSGWEDHDARLHGSLLVAGDLVTSAQPEGCVQLRIRMRARRPWLAAAVAAVATAWAVTPIAGGSVVLALALEVGRGLYRLGPGVRGLLEASPT